MAPPPDHQASKTTVCVMDASGHLGSTLVHRLLHRGYTVHAALHHPLPGKMEYLEGQYRNNKVKVFRADPFDYHSIIQALKGCSGLFYSFEPPSDDSSYDELMTEVQARAAHNALEACAHTDTIHKVVFTSSVTAVIWSHHFITTSLEVDERNWSDISLCKRFKLWHGLSKTVAEKTAWALAMDRSINMVSVNGGLMMSPDLNITNPYLKGAAEMYEDGLFVTVDLNYLVDAHICVFEDVSSYGRYLCFNQIINCNHHAHKLANTLLLPSDKNSTSTISMEDTKVKHQRISNEKLNKLMVNFDIDFHQLNCSQHK
ncbi:hypothetical protein Ddye_004892 [Dipteronia dyeriana]|uniref:NAD(P)-binding domain-containing protein n=1 Tax=Dipteronia dyeriana TaxID=168575 RepID=A0AAE0CP85_9ROSI|nr:hypothetical protein Ddye_004892 [Dipteronia dyeriana]